VLRREQDEEVEKMAGGSPGGSGEFQFQAPVCTEGSEWMNVFTFQELKVMPVLM
jgi:hypothetical protein